MNEYSAKSARSSKYQKTSNNLQKTQPGSGPSREKKDTPTSKSKELEVQPKTLSGEPIRNDFTLSKEGISKKKYSKPSGSQQGVSRYSKDTPTSRSKEYDVQPKTLSGEITRMSKRNDASVQMNSKEGKSRRGKSSVGRATMRSIMDRGSIQKSRESIKKPKRSLRKRANINDDEKEMETQDDSLKDLYRKIKANSTVKSPEECLTQGSSGSKESNKSKENVGDGGNKNSKMKKTTTRKRVQNPGFKSNNTTRKKKYDQELEEWYVQAVSYRCDTTRYRCRYEKPSDLIMQYMFPPLLAVFVFFTTLVLFNVLFKDITGYILHTTALQQITKVQYDHVYFADNIKHYFDHILPHFNCTGLYQMGYNEIERLRGLKHNGRIIKKAVRALSYRWMNATEAAFTELLNCPPSLVIEYEGGTRTKSFA